MCGNAWPRAGSQKAWFWGASPAGPDVSRRQAQASSAEVASGARTRPRGCWGEHRPSSPSLPSRCTPRLSPSSSPGLHLPPCPVPVPGGGGAAQSPGAPSPLPICMFRNTPADTLRALVQPPCPWELSPLHTLEPSLRQHLWAPCSHLGVLGCLFISPSLPAPWGCTHSSAAGWRFQITGLTFQCLQPEQSILPV